MTQRDLNRSVAQSTGETISEISRRGFVPIEDLARESDPSVNWDELEAQRFVSININRQRRHPAKAG
jgi:hypothetical protein